MRALAVFAASVGLVASSAACSHVQHKPGEEYLDKVEFHGNKHLSDKTLITGLGLHRSLKRGRAPDPYMVQVDTDRIRGKYVRSGYFGVDVRVRTERAGDKTRVIYTIEEGDRAKTTVTITGLPEDPALTAEKVREALPLADGKPFDYEKYDLARPALLAVAQNAGYAHAKLDATVAMDKAAHTATVQLDYNPGVKCVFGDVKIVGADGELREAALARVKFKPGQTYSIAAVAETQQELYGFGRFSTVRVEPDAGGSSTVGVSISLSQGARHEIKLGGGVGIDQTSYEVRGRAGYTIQAWPFPLDTFSIDLRPAYALLRDGSNTYEPRIRALAKLTRDDLFLTYAKGTVEGGYNYLAVEAYTSYGPLARLGYELRLGSRRVLARVGWAFENVDFRDQSPLLGMELQKQLGIQKGHTERVGEYQQSLTVDLRDNAIEPSLGAFFGLQVAEATAAAGSEYNFIEIVPEARGYLPILDTGIVLAARGRAGAIKGDVPAIERFFAGGASSQRGFAERHLAPSVTGDVDGTRTTVPYGGAGLLETSLELRIPITKIYNMPFGVVTFLDGGDVTEAYTDLDLANLHWALGGGLRLQTPVGPVRFDLGFRLNRTGAGEPAPDDTYAFHLSIGEAF